MSKKKVESRSKNLNSSSLTNEDEVNRLTSNIESWTLAFLDQQGATDNITRQNINSWLDEMELTFGEGMVNANVMSGYGGYLIAGRVGKADISFANYKEAFTNQIRALSNKDLTKARLLRNSLAFTLGDDNWKSIYTDYDKFIKSSFGLSLNTIKKQFVQKSAFTDNVFFVDSIGREWRPNRYAEMYARTQSREIEDIIMTSEMNELGLDVIQISDASTTTPICLQYENKFFSLTGATPELPIITILPPFHPNCRHRKYPVRGYESSMLSTNININKKVSGLRSGWSTSEKKSIRKQETWNTKNRVLV